MLLMAYTMLEVDPIDLSKGTRKKKGNKCSLIYCQPCLSSTYCPHDNIHHYL